MKILVSIITLSSLWMGLNAGWAEETLGQLTLEEKVAQLFMVSVSAAALSDVVGAPSLMASQGGSADDNLEHLVKDCRVGGLICFKGTIEKQIAMLNRAQVMSRIPLLVGQDCEWGVGMRLTDAQVFPRNMTLGAVTDDHLLYAFGYEVGRQCRAVGVHVNFAPVVDVNTNPNNPIIGTRSFGANREAVARKGVSVLKGLQDGGVLACAKHFPGHGDTHLDSHAALPLLEHGRERLQAEELFPFKTVIDTGVAGIMTAHLSIPALDVTGRPSSLSRPIVTDLLRNELGFTGLIFTDGLPMKGVTAYAPAPEVALRALQAGNDVLVCPLEVEHSIAYVAQAVREGSLHQQELDEHVLRVLHAKEQLGLNRQSRVVEDGALQRLWTDQARALKKMLYQKAVTVVGNAGKVVPLSAGTTVSILQCGMPRVAVADEGAPVYSVPLDGSAARIAAIVAMAAAGCQALVVRIFQLTNERNVYGKLTNSAPAVTYLFDALAVTGKPVIVILCNTPYSLYVLPQRYPVIVAYEDDSDALQAAMNVLWGRCRVEGVLPISLARA